MELKKRDNGIKIDLHPSGIQFLQVKFCFGEEIVEFQPASTVGAQFGELVSAIYSLYPHEDGSYDRWGHRSFLLDEDQGAFIGTSYVDWDQEGDCMTIKMTRRLDKEQILISITEDYGDTWKEFSVDGRDFCYAVAKACTEMMKTYGVYGYVASTEHDYFILHHLLFIKAYALGVEDVYQLTPIDGEPRAKRTCFEREMELLLFDM